MGRPRTYRLRLGAPGGQLATSRVSQMLQRKRSHHPSRIRGPGKMPLGCSAWPPKSCFSLALFSYPISLF